MSSLLTTSIRKTLLSKGVDANRNYGFHWNKGGSSADPCAQTYHGPKAWSEIETQNVRNYILKRKGEWIFYNSIHSYSQLIILPWSYTTSRPSNFNVLNEVADKGTKALKMVHGKTYKVIQQSSSKHSVLFKKGGTREQSSVPCKWNLYGLGIRRGKDTLQLYH